MNKHLLREALEQLVIGLNQPHGPLPSPIWSHHRDIRHQRDRPSLMDRHVEFVAFLQVRKLKQGGAHALYIEGLSIRTETVTQARGQRPWTRKMTPAQTSTRPGGND